MQTAVKSFTCVALLACTSLAASKPHSVTLGKWTTVKWPAGDDTRELVDIKLRPLYVDGKVKEFIVGPTHEITERGFAAQRMFRLNDSLPQETGPTRWRWQKGGWILIDRVSGKVQPVTPPEFDVENSPLNWFRDYAAYCSSADDGHVFAIIVQLGRRKPLLKKSIKSETSGCPIPTWQRDPACVTLEPTEVPS